MAYQLRADAVIGKTFSMDGSGSAVNRSQSITLLITAVLKKKVVRVDKSRVQPYILITVDLHIWSQNGFIYVRSAFPRANKAHSQIAR
jgi:hypothetical protein